MFNLKFLIVFVTIVHMSYGKFFEECRDINKPNTVVPSTKSCSKYIFCNGANSYEGECLAGNYFNPIEGNCDDPENVKCNIEPSDDVKSIYDENFKPDKSELANTGTNNNEYSGDDDGDDGDDSDGEDEGEGDDNEGDFDGGDDNDGGDVNAVNDKDGGDVDAVNDKDGGDVNGAVDNASETAIEEIKENHHNVASIENIKENHHNVIITIQHNQQQQPIRCPQVYGFRNIKNIPNPESCLSFFTCYNGMAIPMLCPAKMYFNAQTCKCEPKMPQSCKLRHSVRLTCYKGINDFVPHPYRCEYYFYCLDGHLMIMRCPQEFTWNYELRTCVHKSISNCYFEKSVIYHNYN